MKVYVWANTNLLYNQREVDRVCCILDTKTLRRMEILRSGRHLYRLNSIEVSSEDFWS